MWALQREEAAAWHVQGPPGWDTAVGLGRGWGWGCGWEFGTLASPQACPAGEAPGSKQERVKSSVSDWEKEVVNNFSLPGLN